MPLTRTLSKIAPSWDVWIDGKLDSYIAPSLRQAQQRYEQDMNMFHLSLCINCKWGL